MPEEDEGLGDLFPLEDFERVYEHLCGDICKKYGITMTAFEILGILSTFSGRNTAKEICSIRKIKSSNASMTIDKLVKSGYIIRQSDEEDRRVQRLILTPQAMKLVEDTQKVHREFKEILFGDLTEEERTTFIKTLRKMQISVRKALDYEPNRGNK